MLSRVAESMFWMSRYIERAENTARFLDVSFHQRLDLTDTDDDSDLYWRRLVAATGDPARYEKLFSIYDAETVTEYLIFSRENASSIKSSIWFARENARTMIESISSEMWEEINSKYHFLQQISIRHVQQDPYKFYKEIKDASHLFQGTTDATMLRNEGWEFMQVGKHLERAINTARLLDAQHSVLTRHNAGAAPSPANIIEWMGVLKSCSGFEAYCKARTSQIEPDTLLQFLVLDRSFPRSIYFAVAATEAALWSISGSSRHHYANSADRLIGKIAADMSYTTIEDIRECGLRLYLDSLQHRLGELAHQIHRIYFAYYIPNSEDDETPLPRMELKQDQARRSHAEQQQQSRLATSGKMEEICSSGTELCVAGSAPLVAADARIRSDIQ